MPSGSAAADEPPPAGKWTYGGETGAVFWGDLDPAWALCKTGTSQSPIDIPSTLAAPEAGKPMGKLAIDYLPIPLRIRNTGTTVSVENIGNNYISVGKKRFELLQFEFHSPSEHMVAGKRYDLEMQLLHKAADGALAVVAVLFEKGKANDALKDVWKKMPKEITDKPIEVAGKAVDLAPFTVLTKGYYEYTGSVTTPPCTEGVAWFVLTEAQEIADKQVQQFRDLTNGRTNRLIQPLGDRKVMMMKP